MVRQLASISGPRGRGEMCLEAVIWFPVSWLGGKECVVGDG